MGSNEETNAAGTDTRPLMWLKVTTFLEDSQGFQTLLHNSHQASTTKSLDNVELLMQGSDYTHFQAYRTLAKTSLSKKSGSNLQSIFPPTTTDRTSSKLQDSLLRVHDGHIVTEPVQRKAPDHSVLKIQKPKMTDKDSSAADVECTAPYDQPQALTTTNMFQANHEDAYDSDVDEGPNAAVAFMANLSSTSATNNLVNKVHSNDNQKSDNVDYQLSQEMHQEEHLDSDAETEIDDNTILYHQYLLDTEAQNVPTEVSADTSDKVSMIAILTDLQTQLDGHAKVNQEKCLEIETLKNELLQCKQEICRLDTHKVKLDLENKVRQEQALVIQRNKRNAELVQENDLLKSTLSGKENQLHFYNLKRKRFYPIKRNSQIVI
ncbi:hypothetical protein Tco_0768958 [Tanacetum coccineum]|uniref:Uncharacterized protein n=1 Tax=Tanacetum coccineum TaxID=301880 RepID=A0ABQ4ZBG5_9ASTR